MDTYEWIIHRGGEIHCYSVDGRPGKIPMKLNGLIETSTVKVSWGLGATWRCGPFVSNKGVCPGLPFPPLSLSRPLFPFFSFFSFFLLFLSFFFFVMLDCRDFMEVQTSGTLDTSEIFFQYTLDFLFMIYSYFFINDGL